MSLQAYDEAIHLLRSTAGQPAASMLLTQISCAHASLTQQTYLAIGFILSNCTEPFAEHVSMCVPRSRAQGEEPCSPMAKWMSMKTNSSSASKRQLMSLDMQKSSNCSIICHVSMHFQASVKSILAMAKLSVKILPAADVSPCQLVAVQQSVSQHPN